MRVSWKAAAGVNRWIGYPLGRHENAFRPAFPCVVRRSPARSALCLEDACQSTGLHRRRGAHAGTGDRRRDGDLQRGAQRCRGPAPLPGCRAAGQRVGQGLAIATRSGDVLGARTPGSARADARLRRCRRYARSQRDLRNIRRRGIAARRVGDAELLRLHGHRAPAGPQCRTGGCDPGCTRRRGSAPPGVGAGTSRPILVLSAGPSCSMASGERSSA